MYNDSCFPHVVNIAVQAVLDDLKKRPRAPLEDLDVTTSSPDEHNQLKRYVEALEADPVGRARNLVGACRSSGQRRDELIWYINDGNAAESWGRDKQGEPYIIPPRELLRDCPTRWSSTYNMGDRVATNYPVRLQ